MVNDKRISPSLQQRLEFVGMMLKEMRLSEGKNQNEYVDFGLTRRQIQTGEYGNNISLAKLITILDCLGYSLKDIDWND
jgi:hypothetical protein